jgi:hypothetical protein
MLSGRKMIPRAIQLIDAVATQAKRLHERADGDVEATVSQGFEVTARDGYVHREPNGTYTVTIRINGGAKHTGTLAHLGDEPHARCVPS